MHQVPAVLADKYLAGLAIYSAHSKISPMNDPHLFVVDKTNITKYLRQQKNCKI
jgi:hypothetical protein